MSVETEGTQNIEDLRFPVGRFKPPAEMVDEARLSALATLAELPSQLRNAVKDLDAAQLDTPYREGGWTVRQVVHHFADSHMNAFIRVRLALTEDWPTVKAYDEKAWAKLHDSAAPVEWSLTLIEGLHARWVMLLQSLTEEQWQLGFVHPDGRRLTIERTTLLYAWHSRHHLAHITHLAKRERW